MQKKNENGIVSTMIITETKVRKKAQIPGFSPTVAVVSNIAEDDERDRDDNESEKQTKFCIWLEMNHDSTLI